MNKRAIPLAFAGLVLATAASLPAGAAVDFTGAWAPGNWTTTIDGIPSQGSASFVGNTQLDLIGGDAGCPGALQGEPGPCQISVTTTNVLGAIFKFHWEFSTDDMDGAAWDLFGVLVDGNRIQLNDPNGLADQSGDAVFQAASSFGWYINCADCLFGGANASITAFAVPEPGSVALFGLGIAGILGLRRKVKS